MEHSALCSGAGVNHTLSKPAEPASIVTDQESHLNAVRDELNNLRVFRSREASDVIRRQRLEIARLKGEPVDELDKYLTDLDDAELLQREQDRLLKMFHRGARKENRGYLMKNQRREKDSQPNHSGVINIEGNQYWLNGWNSKTRTGEPLLNLSVKRK